MTRTRATFGCCGATALADGLRQHKCTMGRGEARTARETGPTAATVARPAPSKPAGRAAEDRPWSNATATVCEAGHRHPSKMEARVCARLTAEVRDAAPFLKAVLFRQARIPLYALAPKENGTLHYASVDFAVVTGGRLSRLIDAKSPTRVSREWRRGAAAVEASCGIKVEEVVS